MERPVSAEDLAARLGTTGKNLREWLRTEAARGHELLRAHQHGENAARGRPTGSGVPTGSLMPDMETSPPLPSHSS
jgi:predicted ArsR family transcriptional regulator